MTAWAMALLAVVLSAASSAGAGPQETAHQFNVGTVGAMNSLPGDLGALPPAPPAAKTPQTRAKVELGRRLFFDTRLSLDNSMSCMTCHRPDLGYADGRPRPMGFGGKELPRHAPTLLNAAYNGPQSWEGKGKDLDDQTLIALKAPAIMNRGDEKIAAERLGSDPDYRKRFRRVYGEAPSLKDAADALAAFQRTLITPSGRFDRYARGNKLALSEQEKRGLMVFIGKGDCAQCHRGPNFTDNDFHNLGVPQVGPQAEDLGRYSQTKDEKDRGAFKTPTLRNVALTAPYMHDGAFGTLEEVVDFYDKGGGKNPNGSDLLPPLGLTDGEKRDLVAFLKALTGRIPKVRVPRG